MSRKSNILAAVAIYMFLLISGCGKPPKSAEPKFGIFVRELYSELLRCSEKDVEKRLEISRKLGLKMQTSLDLYETEGVIGFEDGIVVPNLNDHTFGMTVGGFNYNGKSRLIFHDKQSNSIRSHGFKDVKVAAGDIKLPVKIVFLIGGQGDVRVSMVADEFSNLTIQKVQ